MISRFFIDRPIFAAVLSIAIVLAGGLAAFTLPIAQFPRVSPPTVTVSCNYPGASAKDVAEAVAAPLEKEVNGVEGMMYMSSSCANDGSYSLTVTFHQGTDADVAQVLVQNRVGLAVNKLPDVIKATGVVTRKRSPDILMGVAINSPNGRYNQLYLSNFALRKVRDELARLEGVGDVFLFGQRDYAMRIWVDPERLAARNMTPADVVQAVREQNSEVAAGMIGQQPARSGQETAIVLDTLGRLDDVAQFENIVVRVDAQGRITRVKDVARVELGARAQDTSSRLDGKPTVFCAIFQRPDANALDTAARVRAKMDELKADFPEDVAWEVGFETVPYTSESIKEVVKTLRDAVILVALVVMLFLQNWRSALIPLTAVPVAIVGTFAVMAALGFSLNNLTLFGLVLAIGIVVDDAIVVVEAVEHHIDEGMSPRAATFKAMEQVSGPVIAVGLVLSAVFVPCAFIKGITGLFFRQFALTIAVSTLISAFNSLTLSPALAALLLKPRDKTTTRPLPYPAFPLLGALAGYIFFSEKFAHATGWSPESSILGSAAAGALVGIVVAWPMNVALTWFFRGFNWAFKATTRGYTGAVGGIIGGRVSLTAVLFVVLCGAAGWRWLGPTVEGVFKAVPAGWVKTVLDAGPMVAKQATGAAVAALAGLLLAVPLVFLARRVGRPTVGDAASVAGPERRWQRRLRQAAMPVPRWAVAMLVYGGLLAATYWGFGHTPRGFIPQQDMGYMMVTVQLPDSASTERTDAVMRQMESIVEKERVDGGVRHYTGIVGQSFALNATGSNFGSMFVNLKPYPERTTAYLGAPAIAERLSKAFAAIPDAMIQVFPPPPVRGVGRAGGFAFVVEDRGDMGAIALQAQTDHLIREAAKQPGLGRLFTAFRANVPQLEVTPNARECAAKGVSIDDVNNTLRIYQGSMYVNDFNLFGRTWQVVVQSDAKFRTDAAQLSKLKVRSARGAMVPLGSVVDVQQQNGPLVLTRYNMYPAATINGSTAAGVSSGQGIEMMQELAKRELPSAMAYEWTEMSYLELQAGNTAMILFACAVVAVFLVLAAQYESWTLPLAVILVIPMCLLSGLVGVWVARQDVNIFTQIGFVVLVGLASKNAILIVEFAKVLRAQGLSRREATLEACRLRLRPIVMTSFAFILGVVPLVIARGAGAEMRQTLGVAVFSGMIGVTLFGLLLTPLFFYLIDTLGGLGGMGRLRAVSDAALRWLSRPWQRLVGLAAVRPPVASRRP